MSTDFIIKDKNGNPIHEGERFRFKFMKELRKHIDLIGSFDYNDIELRYEIDIWDNDEYVCLSYVSNGIMYDFELIESKEKANKTYEVMTEDGSAKFHFVTQASDSKEALRNLETNSDDYQNMVKSDRDLTITVKKVK
jgi:hypothetical protein